MIGALIGAALSIGGSLLGSSATKKAANKAADAQLQVADKNNALIQGLYNQNVANFQPYSQSGARANALLDSIIHGTPAQTTQPVGQPVPANDGQMGGVQGGFPLLNDFAVGDSYGGYTALDGRGVNNLNTLFAQQGQTSPLGTPTGPTSTTPGINPNAPQPVGAPMSGFDQFTASPFFRFPYEQGLNALNHGLASGGMLESGDAMKEAMKYGQNHAFAQGLGPYLGLVEGQVNRGAGAASSIAGVSQNYGNSVSNNNQNAANALSNSAIAKGVANNQLYSGIGNALGNFGSSYFKGF